VDQLNLDDQLKQAQIDKTHAERKKIDKEAEAVGTQVKNGFWSEAIKILGGVMLGIGGVVIAYTQYEVGELKAKIAKEELSKAQVERAEAEKAKKAAVADVAAAILKRDAAIREQKDAEAAVAEFKKSLVQTTNTRRNAKPSEAKTRLVFIQFRGDLSRELITDLRTALSGKFFNAPGAERVDSDYQNLVKYFNSAESNDATELASAVESFFASKGCPLKMRVVPATSEKIQNPPLEVWLHHNCTKR
jgi:hypothetical protein